MIKHYLNNRSTNLCAEADKIDRILFDPVVEITLEKATEPTPFEHNARFGKRAKEQKPREPMTPDFFSTLARSFDLSSGRWHYTKGNRVKKEVNKRKFGNTANDT